jgi:hypothetical protein
MQFVKFAQHRLFGRANAHGRGSVCVTIVIESYVSPPRVRWLHLFYHAAALASPVTESAPVIYIAYCLNVWAPKRLQRSRAPFISEACAPSGWANVTFWNFRLPTARTRRSERSAVVARGPEASSDF